MILHMAGLLGTIQTLQLELKEHLKIGFFGTVPTLWIALPPSIPTQHPSPPSSPGILSLMLLNFS